MSKLKCLRFYIDNSETLIINSALNVKSHTPSDLQANLAIQEARYEAAMKDLNKAQAQLDEKQAELEAVQAQYDQAMVEKQVSIILYLYHSS